MIKSQTFTNSKYNEVPVEAQIDSSNLNPPMVTEPLVANVGKSAVSNDSIDINVGKQVNMSDNAAQTIMGSTTGVATYQLKKQLTSFSITDASQNGSVLAVYDINLAIDQYVTYLGTQYVNWRLNHLQVQIQNVSPFASASGSVQVAYVNDPANIPAPSETDALDKILRQTYSKQVKAKDLQEINLTHRSLNVPGAPSDWKFCRARTGASIFNRYGAIVAVVRAKPEIGDGAQFTVSVSGTFEFLGMTENTGAGVSYTLAPVHGIPSGGFEVGKLNDIYNDDRFFFVAEILPEQLPMSMNNSYEARFNDVLQFRCVASDDSTRTVEFYVSTGNPMLIHSREVNQIRYILPIRNNSLSRIDRNTMHITCQLVTQPSRPVLVYLPVAGAEIELNQTTIVPQEDVQLVRMMTQLSRMLTESEEKLRQSRNN